jgi:hypothetical protein
MASTMFRSIVSVTVTDTVGTCTARVLSGRMVSRNGKVGSPDRYPDALAERARQRLCRMYTTIITVSLVSAPWPRQGVLK